jgi:LacI family transcriptional regulator
VLLYLDRAASYTRTMFTGMTTYAVEHGPWRFIAEASPVTFTEALRREPPFDGIIVRVTSRAMLSGVVTAGIPTVNVGTYEHAVATLPTVHLDDEEVGRAGGRYLLQSDCASYAFCGATYLWYSPPRQRGFAQACAEEQRECASFDSGVIGFTQGFETRDERAKRLDTWLANLARPAAVMGCDDTMARLLVEACARLKLRVPEDIAVLGAGNDPLVCDVSDPPLSSVALAADRVGYEAARLLAQLMDRQPAPPRPKVIPPVGVVVRFSTKGATSDDADITHAIEFIRDRVHEGITVDDLLDAVPLSRRALEMRFRTTLGRSPAEEIRRVRIERAKRLLVETDAGMASVAQASGFSSANQLCETFRREAGVSPTRYRKQFRAG